MYKESKSVHVQPRANFCVMGENTISEMWKVLFWGEIKKSLSTDFNGHKMSLNLPTSLQPLRTAHKEIGPQK